MLGYVRGTFPPDEVRLMAGVGAGVGAGAFVLTVFAVVEVEAATGERRRDGSELSLGPSSGFSQEALRSLRIRFVIISLTDSSLPSASIAILFNTSMRAFKDMLLDGAGLARARGGGWLLGLFAPVASLGRVLEVNRRMRYVSFQRRTFWAASNSNG